MTRPLPHKAIRKSETSNVQHSENIIYTPLYDPPHPPLLQDKKHNWDPVLRSFLTSNAEPFHPSLIFLRFNLFLFAQVLWRVALFICTFPPIRCKSLWPPPFVSTPFNDPVAFRREPLCPLTSSWPKNLMRFSFLLNSFLPVMTQSAQKYLT